MNNDVEDNPANQIGQVDTTPATSNTSGTMGGYGRGPAYIPFLRPGDRLVGGFIWSEGKCKTCGETFLGPRGRKYCDKHSRRVKNVGRTVGVLEPETARMDRRFQV